MSGRRVLIPLVFPVIVAAAALFVRRRVVRLIAAPLLLGFCVLGVMSVGLFYFPAALVMAAAACMSEARP